MVCTFVWLLVFGLFIRFVQAGIITFKTSIIKGGIEKFALKQPIFLVLYIIFIHTDTQWLSFAAVSNWSYVFFQGTTSFFSTRHVACHHLMNSTIACFWRHQCGLPCVSFFVRRLSLIKDRGIDGDGKQYNMDAWVQATRYRTKNLLLFIKNRGLQTGSSECHRLLTEGIQTFIRGFTLIDTPFSIVCRSVTVSAIW